MFVILWGVITWYELSEFVSSRIVMAIDTIQLQNFGQDLVDAVWKTAVYGWILDASSKYWPLAAELVSLLGDW